MTYDITLPVEAYVQIGDVQLRHLGAGAFHSEEPVWILEGETVDGSEAAAAWPDYVELKTHLTDRASSHRRVVLVLTPESIERQIWC